MAGEKVVGRAYLTTTQLAERFGCHKNTIYRLVKEGMPKIQFGGGNFRFVEADCMKWLREVHNLPEPEQHEGA